MLENNLKKRQYHSYDVVFADGFWYAWFVADINDLIDTKKAVDVRKRKG